MSHLPPACRRLTLAAMASATLSAWLTGCSGGSNAPSTAAPAAEEKVLNVDNWSDYIAPGVIADFTKESGIKVNYDVYDSNEVLETRLLTGHTNYDVVVPSAAFLERQIKAGIYRKLDKAQLPNLKNMDPEVTRGSGEYDPGNEYGVDYMWITSGPGYDVAKIRQRLPDAPLDSWRMLYDPAVVSHFKDCGVTMLDAPSEVVGTVLIYLGRNANSESPQDLAAAEKVLLAIRPFLRYVHSSRYIDDLANGEICLALGWSGDVKQARDRAHEAGKGIDLAYTIPREGAVRNFDMLAIPADAPHVANAHRFIDFLLRPDIAARNSNFLKYATGDAAAYPLLDPSVRNDPGVYPAAEQLARLVPERAKSQQFTRLLNRMWTRFKTGA
ncbi:MAG TPA: polyamine ABC transporter substrate-binding protein [Steroidobacteraceae bacterium]|nr:polyamine ABC transporter substrate-binding protein [Steroidobacteraceae bacterium]